MSPSGGDAASVQETIVSIQLTSSSVCCRYTQTLPLITLRLLFITPYVFIIDSPLSSYINDVLKIVVTVHLLHSLKANN